VKSPPLPSAKTKYRMNGMTVTGIALSDIETSPRVDVNRSAACGRH
jgi:hypothetical protein